MHYGASGKIESSKKVIQKGVRPVYDEQLDAGLGSRTMIAS